MGRRLLAVLALLALGAAGWWLMRPSSETDEGLVVELEVLDESGRAVPGVQVERVFEGTRVALGPTGTARLTRIVLRALDAPSPEALARALRVEAPFFAPRRGETPRIDRGQDGAWRYRARLHPHGVLRLYVDYTHVGAAKAFPEVGPSADAVEAIGGTQVARHTSPASYRVFAGVREVGVRLEGVADAQGAVGVATRRYVFPAPAPGHVEEHVLVPQEVQPIVGVVVPGDGPRPPSLGGHLRVTQLEEDGRALPLAEVPVREDGTFVARLTGTGRYALEAHLDFFPGTTRLTVLGGASFELTPAAQAAWVDVAHPGFDAAAQPTEVHWQPQAEGGSPQGAALGAVRLGDGRSALALPPGRGRLTLRAEGTQALPPREGRCEVDVLATGPTPCTVDVAEMPHGELVVVLTPEAFGKARGAVVRVGTRAVTLIPGLSERARFAHVAGGACEVRIEWDEAGRASTLQRPTVRAGSTVTLDVEGRGP